MRWSHADGMRTKLATNSEKEAVMQVRIVATSLIVSSIYVVELLEILLL